MSTTLRTVVGLRLPVTNAFTALALSLMCFVVPCGASQINANPTCESSTTVFDELVNQKVLKDWAKEDSVTILPLQELREEPSCHQTTGFGTGSSDAHRGLFATRDISKGDVIVSIDYWNMEDEITRDYPKLRSMVDEAIKKVAETQTSPQPHSLTSSKLLSVIQFLREVVKCDEGKASPWSSYVHSLPRNVSNVAWYWTPHELECVVNRGAKDSLAMFRRDLQVYHAVMQDLRDNFPPLSQIYNRQTVEWLYVMWRTRGFGSHLFPILDFADHNPQKAVSVFETHNPTTGRKTASLIATHDIRKGDIVYNSYGDLSIMETSQQYGFVEETPVYFEVPSIQQDILTSPNTRNEPACTSFPVKFFGNVTTQLVEAKLGARQKQSTAMKAFRPTERAYACIRVLLQSNDVAGYIAGKLKSDWKQYHDMATAEKCQSSEGNFPLIRRANQMTALMMQQALEVAEKGRDRLIPYPDMPNYIQ